EHLLKLPQLAIDQLGTGKPDQFCFPGKNGKLGGFSKFKKELDELSGVQGWRHHDLRRTASTNMQELGIEPHIIDMVLN
ncbi:site-specific integrase, partial [Pseudomonas sp. BGM005]|nr:site-specific integrase [Pseudomonas sp. BG5]